MTTTYYEVLARKSLIHATDKGWEPVRDYGNGTKSIVRRRQGKKVLKIVKNEPSTMDIMDESIRGA